MYKFSVGLGLFAIVDDCDMDLALCYSWNIESEKKPAPKTRYNGRYEYLSRVIGKRMGFDSLKQVDHENRNKLDNRRINLREATNQQNCCNKIQQKNSKSPYKGVSWKKEAKKYVAQIQINGKRTSLGYFDDPEDAAYEYDKAARKHYGRFARTNFT